jgi:hypothetical protein
VSYRLVFTDPNASSAKFRDVFENVWLHDISNNYNVYVFYYAGVIPNDELESKLRALGKMSGSNLLINIGSLDDPSFSRIAKTFQLENFPVITMTANASLASVKAGTIDSTAYVRLDGELLSSSVDNTVKTVQELYLLFLRGEIARALEELAKEKRDAIISRIKDKVTNLLKKVCKFLQDRDITISLFEGKLELKKNTGPGAL